MVIGSDLLEACRAAQGSELRPGDILLVRTGFLDFYATGNAGFEQAGLGLDAVSFIDDHEIVAVGADNSAIESIPFDNNEFLTVHIELLVKRGVTLHGAPRAVAARGRRLPRVPLHGRRRCRSPARRAARSTPSPSADGESPCAATR